MLFIINEGYLISTAQIVENKNIIVAITPPINDICKAIFLNDSTATVSTLMSSFTAGP